MPLSQTDYVARELAARVWPKPWMTLAPDVQDHYRGMAAVAIAASASWKAKQAVMA